MAKRKNAFVSYEDAEKLVQDVGIISYTDYKQRYKEFTGLPSDPYQVYKDTGWNGWPMFLGVNFVTYEEAMLLVQEAKICSFMEYKERYSQIIGLPSHPYLMYKNKGWVDWSTFLGKGKRMKKVFVSYEEAQRLTQEAGFSSSVYRYHYKEIPGLPSSPEKIYKEWIDWPTFLGRDSVKSTVQ